MNHKVELFALYVATWLRGPVNYKWTLAAIQGLSIIATSYWIQVPPSPGIAVAVLGLVAVVMTIRAEEKWGRSERIAWLVLALGLMVVEIQAIQRDHERQVAIEVQSRKDENERFAGVLKDNRDRFDATMGKLGTNTEKLEGLAKTQEKINTLARKNLESITGGSSFAYVLPHITSIAYASELAGNRGNTLPESAKLSFNLSVENAGDEALTGVTVTLAHVKGETKDKKFAITDLGPVAPMNMGTISPHSGLMLPVMLTPALGVNGISEYNVNVSAQNGGSGEKLLFRPAKADSRNWAYKFNVVVKAKGKRRKGDVYIDGNWCRIVKEQDWTEPPN
jgi:hypothetical protein